MAEKDRDHIRRLREEANAIRKQEQAKRRRNRMLAQIGIIVGAVVVVGGIVALVMFGSQWFNPRPDFQAESTIEVTTSEGETVSQPIATTERGGILVGAADAPATFEYWYDYSCPHCVEYHTQSGQIYRDLIATGQVKVEFIPINYVAPYGAQAGAAVLAAVQHQPEEFFTVDDGLFSIPAEQQQSWSGGDYASILPSFGITDEAALAAIDEGTYVRIVNDSTKDARSNGVQGTPSVAVNGEMLAEIPVGEGIYQAAIDAGANVELPSAATPEGDDAAADDETPTA